MKKQIITVLTCLVSVISFAQGKDSQVDSIKAEKFLALLETLITDQVNPLTRYGANKPIFQLFKTTNMWTFLKLNTKNGTITQVQYDVKGNDRFESYLNFVPLSTGENAVPGRFTLYSTDNMWTFLLLDQIDGRVWQVQWSKDEENRGIVPLE